jgi:hypothetical protein
MAALRSSGCSGTSTLSAIAVLFFRSERNGSKVTSTRCRSSQSGPYDDQVDATTQYLDFMAKNPALSVPPKRGMAFATTYTRGPLYWSSQQSNILVPGGVWGKGKTWWG